jgi:hypothetical protein
MRIIETNWQHKRVLLSWLEGGSLAGSIPAGSRGDMRDGIAEL